MTPEQEIQMEDLRIRELVRNQLGKNMLELNDHSSDYKPRTFAIENYTRLRAETRESRIRENRKIDVSADEAEFNLLFAPDRESYDRGLDNYLAEANEACR